MTFRAFLDFVERYPLPLVQLTAGALYRLSELAPTEEKQLLINDLALPNPKFIETEVRELLAQGIPSWMKFSPPNSRRTR